MTDVKSINPQKYNSALADVLKKEPEFEVPDWAVLAKTSTHKKRPSTEEDFWYKRAASILRQIYINGVVGVERLRTRYGGRKNRGSQPAEFRKGAGKIIRVILQQAEKAGYLEKAEGKKKGRKLTAQGKKYLESVEVK